MRLTFRKKALLLILPILGIVSTVYTFDAIRTEKEIVRTEIIKRAEAITALATRTGELPLLSGNPELMRNTISSLRANSEVAAVTFFDNRMNMLIHDGPPITVRLPALSPSAPMSMAEDKTLFVFYSPVFTVRAREEIDIFDGGTSSRHDKENIGWIRLGFSKGAMNEAVGKVVSRGVMLAAIFTVGSSIAVFFLITIATRPLMVLIQAVRKLEKGEYPEIKDLSSTDEIGELAVAFNRMIKAIKEREADLVESENRIRELFERVEHAIFRLDSNGNIIEANSKFRDLFGDVDKLSEVLAGEKDVINCFQKASSGSAMHREVRAVGRDGELVISLSLYPVIGQGGDIGGCDGYLMDITEKKRMEEGLLRSQKLEAVGTLAGGMAHDFNNVLTAVLGYSEFMLMDIKEGQPFYRAVSTINDAAKRGADLAMKILSVTRREQLVMRAVDLNELVRSAIDLLLRSIPKDIQIVTVLGEDLPMIMADPSQIQQVLLNLAINARDAMVGGGTLTVGSEMADEEGGASGRPPGTGGFIKLYVSDTGVGMSNITQGRIFDPFYTTKEAGKGTGLGLYIVHSIVTNHGGHINLYSEQGKGTLFNVYLPVVKGEKGTEREEVGELRGSETILMIDDEAAVREMSRDLLTRLGYEVILAGGGSEGLSIFREMQDKISLVVLDMMMPERGGKEIFRLLKEIKPDVRVLLCSGFSQEGYAGIEDLLREGAYGFLQKPFSRQQVALALRKALS
ncbi:MAG: ATP-binding protein [Thermodesulfovibrionales bacterium]